MSHEPATTPYKSLYFDYEVFPFKPTAENDAKQHDVIVVGAGPVGLALALDLARRGVSVVVLEKEAQLCGGSRAVALARRSMEILHTIDMDEKFLEHAITWSLGWSYYRKTQIYEMRLPAGENDQFAPMTNLQQNWMERLLVQAAQAHPLIDLRHHSLVTAIENDADSVTLTVDTPQGEYALTAPWLVATDGARSTIRRLSGLRLAGQSHEGRFVIVDLKLDLDEPAGRRCYFDPPWCPGRSVLWHKEPFGIWRLDYLIPDDVSEEEALDPANLRRNIEAHLAYIGADVPWEIEWATIYRANTLTLESYRHGRTLFCGDAAHLLPIFGVRGLNTGLQDMQNLGWKLASVLKGLAPDALLDSYSAERVDAAKEICEEAVRSVRFMTPPTRGYRVLRDATLSLSLTEEFPRGLLHWRTSRPHDYTASTLNLPQDAGAQPLGCLRPGTLLPNLKLQGGSREFLHDALGSDFTVLVFSAGAVPDSRLAQQVRAAAHAGLPVRLVLVTGAADVAGDGQADIVACDNYEQIQQALGIRSDMVYLIRPDQYVSACWASADAASLAPALDRALGRNIKATGQAKEGALQ